MNPLSLILDFLSARILVIFAIAGGALLFLLLPDMALEKLRIKDYGDVWRTSALFIAMILWVYLFSKLAIFLFDGFNNYRTFRTKQKTTLMYLQSKSSMKMGEIAILADQKKRNEHQFITTESSEYMDLLCGKGLLIKMQWIKGIGGEYRIPNFVWNNKKLRELANTLTDKEVKSLRRSVG